MLDEAFKRSRKFIGIPIAILLVVVIALSTGGAALAAYLTQTARVPVTVQDPLTFEWDEGGNWTATDTGEPVWEVSLFACETASNGLMIYNAANVDVPLSIQADTTNPVEGIGCSIMMWYDDMLVDYVPAGAAVIVEVVVSADCDTDLSGGPAQTEWTLRFFRG